MSGVTVLGSLNVDLVMRVPRLPGRGETVAGGRLSRLPGGKGANQAVACARAGASVRMAGRCGQDDGGDLLIGALQREGVDTSLVRRLADVSTGTATILVDSGGENMIAVTAGASENVDFDDAATACAGLGPGDVLLMQLEIPLPTVREAASQASTRGATVVLNAAPVPDDVPGLLTDVDVLIANEHEVHQLAAAYDVPQSGVARAAQDIAKRFDCLVVATLGSRGAITTRGAEPDRFRAPKVQATDTIGAGDAFTGYVAAALHHDADERSAVATAVLAASLAVTRPGAQDSVPRLAELRHLSLTGGS
ncbi:MAG: ribokinase [Nocardioidaceae bacterium]